MKAGLGTGDFARAAFFALLPATAAGGAMGLPLLLGLTAAAGLGPSVFQQLLEKRPVSLALLAAFGAWAAISSQWSAWDGQTAAKIGALIALGVLFATAAAKSAAAARLTLSAGLAAFFVMAVLLGIEATWDMPLNRAIQPEMAEGELNRNPSRGLIVLLALTWPAIAGLIALSGAARVTLAIVVVVAAAALSTQFDQLVTLIAFGAGLAVFAFAFAAPRFAILAPSFGLAAWMLAAPFITPLLVASPRFVEAVPLSWAARIGIWRYTCARIMEQPWIGHGLDAGRAVTDRIAIRGLEMRGVPVHPHSVSLQIWFDLGLVGAALAALLLAYGGWRLSRAFSGDKPAAAAAAATLAMLGLMANVGWSLWQEWWMATLFLAAGMIAAVGARGARA